MESLREKAERHFTLPELLDLLEVDFEDLWDTDLKDLFDDREDDISDLLEDYGN